MSIYVEGFELPNYNEKMFKGDPMGYICYLYVNSDGTADLEIKGKDYPVKNVPAPHGRLIDADKLSISILKAMNNGRFDSVIGMIDTAPTIIEAEEANDKT